MPTPWARYGGQGQEQDPEHTNLTALRQSPQAPASVSLHTSRVVLLLEADERLLAGRWGCWDSGDLELGGPPTRPCPSTHPFKHRPPTTPGAALAPEPPAPGAGQLSGGPDSDGRGAVCQGSVTVCRAILVSGSDNSVLAAWASRIASLTGSMVHLVFILMLSKIYRGPHVESERAVTRRASIVQVVSFHSPVYTFFFKSRFGDYPGNCHTLLGVRNEECAAGSCLAELAQELPVIMVGKQVINAMQEIPVPALPGLKGCWQGFRLHSEKRKAAVSLAASQVLWEFGFITTFGAACLLAPLFALLSNWVEIRLDARQFIRLPNSCRTPTTSQLQRSAQPPVRVRAPGAGLPGRGGAASPAARYRAFREDDAHYSRTYWTLGPPVRPSSRCSRCRGPQDAGPRSHPRTPPKALYGTTGVKENQALGSETSPGPEPSLPGAGVTAHPTEGD
ncbi:hypothetical protein Celaphus_00002850 [Cervus elaphus hippelaphus]|uniref:Anoctamin n=1 Tax=Cervus elaphus hippelaphus TaxID=46360 RepID=A0A212CHE7_CEREH|nr:hypothetical protein Celaphus_00002850 [Cervus elaphus hippelaphus]